jgi:hypothetical protein
MTSTMSFLKVSLAAALLLSFGCGGDPDPQNPTDPMRTPVPVNAPTYHRDVAPILAGHCQGCHTSQGIAPFPLLTYAHAQPLAAAIVTATTSRKMPPWGARETSECKPRYGWQRDIRLDDKELATLQAWASAGAPEGDPRTATALPTPPTTSLSRVDLELGASAPYVVSGTKDQFRCFVMDPKLATDRFLSGTNVIPGNPKVVHHAVLVADPTRASEKLLAGGTSYDCFGGFSNIPDVRLLQVWTPGGVPVELPSQIGIHVPKNSLIVMQIHYHPHGGPGEPDQTRFQLEFAGQIPQYLMVPGLPVGNAARALPNGDGLLAGPNDGPLGPAFRIPANMKDHTETMQFTWPKLTADGKPMPTAYIYGLAAHMHYIGRDLKLDIDRAEPGAEPRAECLTQEPDWNFDWQRSYAYAAPIESLPTLRAGDKLKVRCSYDNTLTNPFVQRALADTGRRDVSDVVLGETTLDEMCLVLMQLLVKVF